tara:strand:- start:258 stop:623 length:366 start_codon:yes stop_codon:yes gene_type:complete
MDLMLLVLKTGDTLIAAIEQLEHEPRCHLERPYLVGGKTKVTLSAWPAHSSDQHILLHTDSLLTVCDPSPTIKAMYLKKIGKTEEDFKPQEEQVLLNEDEQLPNIDDYEDDHGYEPVYQEV